MLTSFKFKKGEGILMKTVVTITRVDGLTMWKRKTITRYIQDVLWIIRKKRCIRLEK